MFPAASQGCVLPLKESYIHIPEITDTRHGLVSHVPTSSDVVVHAFLLLHYNSMHVKHSADSGVSKQRVL